MCEKITLIHLTKGLYYRVKQSIFGTIPIGEQEIMDYYLSENKGVLLGYRLYNQKVFIYYQTI